MADIKENPFYSVRNESNFDALIKRLHDTQKQSLVIDEKMDINIPENMNQDTIEILGKTHVINDLLINKIISCIPVWFSTDERNLFLLGCTKNAVSQTYDPNELLEFGH